MRMMELWTARSVQLSVMLTAAVRVAGEMRMMCEMFSVMYEMYGETEWMYGWMVQTR